MGLLCFFNIWVMGAYPLSKRVDNGLFLLSLRELISIGLWVQCRLRLFNVGVITFGVDFWGVS